MAREVGIDASEETVRKDLSNAAAPVLGCRATRRRERRDLMARVTQVDERQPVGLLGGWMRVLRIPRLISTRDPSQEQKERY